jgi:ribosomal protein S18 acetylase RimI-like enzyme
MNTPLISPPDTAAAFAIRHELRPGDLGSIIYLHGTLYARDYGFEPTFEAYVAGPLAQFACSRTDRDRLWIAEQNQRIVGSIAIVGVSPSEAQLRWFIVDPSCRRQGLGKRLLDLALTFARACAYESIFLWTGNVLREATRLYRSVGFERVEEIPGAPWGVQVVEEKYAMRLMP